MILFIIGLFLVIRTCYVVATKKPPIDWRLFLDDREILVNAIGVVAFGLLLMIFGLKALGVIE